MVKKSKPKQDCDDKWRETKGLEMEEEVEEKKVWTAKFGLKAFFSPQPLKNSGWNDILHFFTAAEKKILPEAELSKLDFLLKWDD